MIGWFCPAWTWTKPFRFETSMVSLSVTSLLWWTRGSTSILMPTSWYWNDVTGTMFPPIVVPVLKVVVGIGTRSPMTSCAF